MKKYLLHLLLCLFPFVVFAQYYQTIDECIAEFENYPNNPEN